MKIKFTKHFPYGNFCAISLFGTMYVKGKSGRRKKSMICHPERYYRLVEHERTHWEQQKEMLVLPFFIWYGVEWFFKLFTEGKAYKNVSFEREARDNELDTDEYCVLIHFKDKDKKYISNFNLAKQDIVDSLEMDEVKYIEFLPFGIGGSILNREHFAWVKYILHRTIA